MKELELQKNCVKWFRYQHGDKILFHVPNGGHRNIAEAFKFKLMGVLAGVPDLFLAFPKNGFGGLFIELKTKSGLTQKQGDMIVALKKAGYAVAVCKTLDGFISSIENYLDGVNDGPF